MPPLDIGAFDALSFYRYRVDVRLHRPLVVPAHQRAVLWRGAFGTVFRSLVCHDITLACETCPLRAACPFPRVFAPSIPEGRPAIARLRDPPRPFVLMDPHPGSPSLPAGESIALGLVLVGTAVVDLPYFVVSLRRLGSDGIGVARVRLDVEAVRCADAFDMAGPVVFERGSELVRPARVPLRARDLMRPGDAEAHRVRVRFITPTDLRTESAAAESASQAPPFGVLVRRARNRAGALATFFGDGAIAHDAPALGVLADGVALGRSEVARAEIMRKSSRTGERHPIGGVIGSAIYEGQGIAECMPWLRLAEALGVGKHATFGNGRIAVEVLA
jgi:hypothetical protein